MIRIYPDSYAAMCLADAGKKYRPSNGTEGELFIASWCAQCERDHGMMAGLDLEDCDDNQICDLIGRTYLHAVTDAEYPMEWQYSKEGQPCCTAFVEKGKPIPPPKDENTKDMFMEEGDE